MTTTGCYGKIHDRHNAQGVQQRFYHPNMALTLSCTKYNIVGHTFPSIFFTKYIYLEKASKYYSLYYLLLMDQIHKLTYVKTEDSFWLHSENHHMKWFLYADYQNSSLLPFLTRWLTRCRIVADRPAFRWISLRMRLLSAYYRNIPVYRFFCDINSLDKINVDIKKIDYGTRSPIISVYS